MTQTHRIWAKLANDLAGRDPQLRPLIERIGKPQIALQPEAFRALVEAILSQQLAPKAARSIIDRVTGLKPPFPTPGFLLSARTQSLRKAGVSPQKIGYLRSLSERWKDATWRSGWRDSTDEALVLRLTEVKGIGEWTAHMFLIFSLGRPNILPIGDFGIRRGVQLLFRMREMPLPRELPALLTHWDGAYSVASWYLWQSLDQKLLGER